MPFESSNIFSDFCTECSAEFCGCNAEYCGSLSVETDLLFILADLSSFSNTLKRCRNEKKELSVFNQRTEEASAVQYFQVRKVALADRSGFQVPHTCGHPCGHTWAGWWSGRMPWAWPCHYSWRGPLSGGTAQVGILTTFTSQVVRMLASCCTSWPHFCCLGMKIHLFFLMI